MNINKKLVIKISSIVLFSIAIFLVLGYFSSYIGWYGYKKWEDRKYSLSIEESKKRKVFIKQLNYKIDSFHGTPFPFEAFIEKGFKWGRHSSDKTIILNSTDFPYQLSYNYRPTDKITILMRQDQFPKFDSIGKCLRKPDLSDTISLEIGGEGITSGIIKVWK